MTFDVRVEQQTFKNLVPAFKTDFGLWNSGRPMEFELNAGQAFSSELGAKVVYKIATVVQPPFVIEDASAPHGYKGYVVDLLDSLAELMNFDYKLYEAPDKQWGRMNPDKTWNGVIRELIDGKADIAAGAFP